MLRDSLKLIASGEVASDAGLARRLGVTPALAQQVLGDLVRLGYLTSASSFCSRCCQGCPVAGSCAGLPEMLTLTPRGRAALGRGGE